nr:NTPase KAP family P-loop domain-containing protein 1 isoform X10 [Camelus dromedarius]XP_031314703.1 NTPase KAP family P-loop domain-containing protein 1 isoform X10 [Camelus dromedarius]XP_031314704.1 NTPase KAP family P-loop domain-containing protein 1 isoform X10 [Camelus dromedarius]
MSSSSCAKTCGWLCSKSRWTASAPITRGPTSCRTTASLSSSGWPQASSTWRKRQSSWPSPAACCAAPSAPWASRAWSPPPWQPCPPHLGASHIWTLPGSATCCLSWTPWPPCTSTTPSTSPRAPGPPPTAISWTRKWGTKKRTWSRGPRTPACWPALVWGRRVKCAAAAGEILTEDDVYCSCLAKTLCHVPVPVTVGFYAPFGCRLHLMLDKITAFWDGPYPGLSLVPAARAQLLTPYPPTPRPVPSVPAALMQQEATQREGEELQRVQCRPRSVRGWGFPQLLWYLVFLQPVITEVHLRRKNVKFLFIRFSAWQYAGTDKLWAGLVTTLCEGIRHHYGALPFSVYSVMGNKPGATPGFCQREWHCRLRVCLALLALLAALSLGVGLLYLSVGSRSLGHGVANGSLLQVVGGAATTLSGSGLLMAVYSVGKHLFVSQRKKIERLVSREKFGSQLGFMCEVKKEVELLTDFLCFLEIYQRCRLRVVLEVTGLDTCYPERVVGVLNAMNTLLSDSHAPFIFILVVDPSILAACLESAGSMKGTADNGYLFLNRTVTLPFSVPIMGRRTKLQFLHDAVQSRDDLLYREMTRKLRPPGGAGDGESTRLLGVETRAGAQRAQSRVDAEAARRIREALFCLHDERDCLYEYVPDNVVSMRPSSNLPSPCASAPAPLRPSPRQAVAWVVLANQWPCRLSWVLQCLEDRQQAGGAPDARARLWDVFCDNSRELHTMTKALQNVLDLDGDPELFERFLDSDFPFTVAEAQSLLRCTVNLDHSIRRRMGLIRAVSALKPPSPPKSPAHDAPHTANGANHAPGEAMSGRSAGHTPAHASEAHHPQDWAQRGKPRPVA